MIIRRHPVARTLVSAASALMPTLFSPGREIRTLTQCSGPAFTRSHAIKNTQNDGLSYGVFCPCAATVRRCA